MKEYSFIRNFEIWGKTELLTKLEKYPDIIETFFYRTYKDLEKFFRYAELSLVSIKADKESNWIENDPKVLNFNRKYNDESDLILDIIVKNRGTVDTIITKIEKNLTNVIRKLKGLPGEGLLYSQKTYDVPLNYGEEGKTAIHIEPPIIVKSGAYERFKIRLNSNSEHNT